MPSKRPTPTTTDRSEPVKKQKQFQQKEDSQQQPVFIKEVDPEISKAKKLWETLRMKKAEDRPVVMEQMMQLIRNKIREMIFKHDCSRIVQSCIKFGNQEHRNEIASALKGSFVELAMSKYGKFIVTKLIAHCASLRHEIIAEFNGHILKLVKSKEAIAVIEEIYFQFANALEKTRILEEFFGAEYKLFKAVEARKMADILAKSPEKRNEIMKNTFQNISALASKGLLGTSTLVQSAIAAYANEANEIEMRNLFEIVKEQLVEILHTKEGAQIVCKCILFANAKERKVIVKSFKPYMHKICKEQYGHYVLLRLFDVMDDTVLIKAQLFKELVLPVSSSEPMKSEEKEKAFCEVVEDKYGRGVLLYLLCGRSTKYFSPAVIEMLQSGEEISEKTSKKPDDVRKKELVEGIVLPLLQLCVAQCEELMKSKFGNVVVMELVKYCCVHQEEMREEELKMFEKLLEQISYCFNSLSVLEDRFASRVVKFWITEGLEKITTMIVGSAISNLEAVCESKYACFIVVCLLENLQGNNKSELQNMLKEIDLALLEESDALLKVKELVV